jgi:hypothetical protein
MVGDTDFYFDGAVALRAEACSGRGSETQKPGNSGRGPEGYPHERSPT